MMNKIIAAIVFSFFISDTSFLYAKGKNLESRKQDSMASKIVKAKSKKDFETILYKLGLLSRLAEKKQRERVINAAIKIPASNRLKIFYYVQKSSTTPFSTEYLFEVYGDVPEGEMETLYQASLALFWLEKCNVQRSNIISTLKKIKNEKRIATAKYLRGIISNNKGGVWKIINTILEVPEDDRPDVIGRVLTIHDSIDIDAIDLIGYISAIPKDRRDLMMEEARKLYNKDMNLISKGQLIHGLSEIKEDEFNETLELGKELFFDNTLGGHMSLIFDALQKNLSKDMRKPFVNLVKPLLNSTDSSMTRKNLICVFSNFSTEQRKIFLKHMPSLLSTETKEKVFDKLGFAKWTWDYPEARAKQRESIGKFIQYYQANLMNNGVVSEEKFLSTVLSAIQYVKMNEL